MKGCLLLICFGFIPLSFGQQLPAKKATKIELNRTNWMSNIHCFTSENNVSYELTKTTDDLNFHWGNHISFQDGTFSTSYSAPCGVDCFTNVTGTYKYVALNRVEIYVESIQRNGFCSEESEVPKKIFGIYLIEQTKKGLKLTKQ